MVTPNPDPTFMPVLSKRCAECLFSTAKVVPDWRRDQVLDECASTGRAFICHKASAADQYAVCRGFYDADASAAVVLARLLGLARFVPLKEET